MSSFRTEMDSLGPVKVASEAYWGAQTQRAIENFPISGVAMPARFVRALAIIKKAWAQTRGFWTLDNERTANRYDQNQHGCY